LKVLKNLKVFGVAFVMVFWLLAPVVVNADVDDDINITIMGWPVEFYDQGPIMVDGVLLTPVRAVFEMLDFNVYWDSGAERVILSNYNYVIVITIGSNEFTIGDEIFTFDVPAQIIGDRTLVPIRTLLEGIEMNVRWLVATQILSIEFRPIAG